jgi:hypothetical protein
MATALQVNHNIDSDGFESGGSEMRGIWLAAAGALALFLNTAAASAVTIDFNGIAAPGSYVEYGNGPVTLSGATFTGTGSADIFVVDPGYYSISYANGGFLNIDYGGSTNTLNISLPAGMHFVSFDFGGLGDGTVTADVSINGGSATTISSSKSLAGTASLDHFAFSSLADILTLTLVLPDAPLYNAIDNFSFTATVPETSTWAMLLLGFGGIGLVAYRRRSRTILTAG